MGQRRGITDSAVMISEPRAFALTQYLMLLGDSTPRDDHVRRRLARLLRVDMRRPEVGCPSVHERVKHLEALLRFEPSSCFVLFGRSSGARVVTQVAANPAFAPQIAAVVALGYPFRNPNRPEEPERYLHLPQLTVPCLIVQGAADAYGGLADILNYQLSSSTRVRFCDADHRLEPPDAVWDEIGRCVRGFLDGALSAALTSDAA